MQSFQWAFKCMSIIAVEIFLESQLTNRLKQRIAAVLTMMAVP